MKRRSFISAVIGLFCVRDQVEEEKPGWILVEENTPLRNPMKLYGMGLLIHRSYNVLCKNCAQVFLGFAVLEWNAYLKRYKPCWYQSDDYTMQFPMAVDAYKLIDAKPEKLRCQWHLVDWEGGLVEE